MKKILSLVMVLALCLCVSAPAFAAEFVPSVSYKDGPVIVKGEQDAKEVTDCLIVSTIKEAEDKATDITQDDRDLLLEVYAQLMSGEMTLPLENDYVIRDLVDVSYKYNDCRTQDGHGDKSAELKEAGKTLTVVFDMDLGKAEQITVLVYIENEKARSASGEWVVVENVVNNGDGTLTVEFEDICPVAFVVEKTGSADTGDAVGSKIGLLVCVMLVCAAGIVVLTCLKKKRQ